MNRHEAAALDNYITGHWGEDQFAGMHDEECGEALPSGEVDPARCDGIACPCWCHEGDEPSRNELSDDAWIASHE